MERPVASIEKAREDRRHDRARDEGYEPYRCGTKRHWTGFTVELSCRLSGGIQSEEEWVRNIAAKYVSIHQSRESGKNRHMCHYHNNQNINM
jgi:hypothetical protein